MNHLLFLNRAFLMSLDALKLRKMLDDDTISASQKDNIEVVIKAYNNEELPKRIGRPIFVQDGKV
jgi:hypothetical protein